MDSVTDEVEGIKLYKELSDLWKRAGMFTHKWLSNSVTVLKEIPQHNSTIYGMFTHKWLSNSVTA